MREAIRVAMLDAGRFNVDSMWGPPWSPAWLRNDPFVFAPRLQGLSMYISAASGLPGKYDHPRAPIDYYNTPTAWASRHSPWPTPAHSRSAGHARYPGHLGFPSNGTHSWPYWSENCSRPAARSSTPERLVTVRHPRTCITA